MLAFDLTLPALADCWVLPRERFASLDVPPSRVKSVSLAVMRLEQETQTPCSRTQICYANSCDFVALKINHPQGQHPL